MTYDAAGNASASLYDMSRPGFRVGNGSAANAAYREMVHDLTDAWKTPEQLTTDACPEGVDPKLWAYSQMVNDTCNAWRPKDDVQPSTKDAALHILPVGAVQKFVGINAGEACTIDGRRGRWEEGPDGYLYCRPLPLGPAPRADAVPPRTMSVEDSEKIKQAAYEEMCRDLVNAWRS
jgi:hypothetical protein